MVEASGRVAHGQLVSHLLALVVSGDVSGARPVDAGFSYPLDYELSTPAPAAPVASDTLTRARVDWAAVGVKPATVGQRAMPPARARDRVTKAPGVSGGSLRSLRVCGGLIVTPQVWGR
jgi:hypothetical protein